MGNFLIYAFGLFWGLAALPVHAYTANKVWFEFLDDGRYRVTVNYTIPALKEYREAYVIFRKKKEAEAFYWKLVRGADFYPEIPGQIRYIPPKTGPEPW
ncbi:MAG: hypothetical protein ACOVS5_08530 [Oligoflexus sp.]|jgi:hypothetical protein